MSSALSELPTSHQPTKQKWWRPFTKPILSSFDNDNQLRSHIQLQPSRRFHDQHHPSKLNLSNHPQNIFGTRLEDSLQLASVAISMIGHDSKAYIYGFIPVVVAKCGLYLKQDGTLIEGIFRISGSTKRIKELQSIFDSPPFYGKDLDWRNPYHHYPTLPTTNRSDSDCQSSQSESTQKPYFSIHDASNVLRRYLMCLPEPLIPQSMYEDLKEVLVKYAHDQSRQIKLFKSLISTLSPSSQYLLLYLLDLLAVFANRSDKNLMTANNLAVVFQPALCPANPTTSEKLNRIIYAHQRPPLNSNPIDRAAQQEFTSPTPLAALPPTSIQQESLQEQESIMKEVKQAQAVLEFMILNQNHFVVGLRPQIKVSTASNQISNGGLNLKNDDRRDGVDEAESKREPMLPSTPRPTSCQSRVYSPNSPESGPDSDPSTISSRMMNHNHHDIKRSNTLPPPTHSKSSDWNGIMNQSIGSPVPTSIQPVDSNIH